MVRTKGFEFEAYDPGNTRFVGDDSTASPEPIRTQRRGTGRQRPDEIGDPSDR